MDRSLSVNTGKVRNKENEESITANLSKATPDVRKAYDNLESLILSLGDDITIAGRKHCITFLRKKNFADVVVYPMQLNLYINMKKGALVDPKKLTIDVSRKGHWGNGDYAVIIRDTAFMKYIQGLIEQSYRTK